MIEFWKITPGGNPTVLLRQQDVPFAMRPQTAAVVMDPQHLGCEQVGFVRFEPGTSSTLPDLAMMGGEFCLNATRAFAGLLAQEGCLTPTAQGLEGEVTVSGADAPVRVRVVPGRDGSECDVSACLTFSDEPSIEWPDPANQHIALIRLPGITHIVLMRDSMPAPAELPAACATLRQRFGLEAEDSVGCLWLDDADDAIVLRPVVWVRATQSLCLESACGSGTLACALVLRSQTGGERFAIQQPSGLFLEVMLELKHDALHTWVGGPARIVAQGLLRAS